jgi:hypothetical protein
VPALRRACLPEAVVRAPRGGDGAASGHEGMARQAREEGRIVLFEGFVRQFWGWSVETGRRSSPSPALESLCRASVTPREYAGNHFSGCLAISTRYVVRRFCMDWPPEVIRRLMARFYAGFCKRTSMRKHLLRGWVNKQSGWCLNGTHSTYAPEGCTVSGCCLRLPCSAASTSETTTTSSTEPPAAP